MTVHTDCRSHGATQQVRHIQTNGWKEKWWENDAVDIFVSLRMILPLLDALGTKLQLQTHIATNRSLALNFWLKKWKSITFILVSFTKSETPMFTYCSRSHYY